MKQIRSKREQFIKSIQSKQRNDKLSQKRGNLFSSFNDQSLISLIFLFIDQQHEQKAQLSNRQDFEDFLQIIYEEVEEETEDSHKIRYEIITAIMTKYTSHIQNLCEITKQASNQQIIDKILAQQKIINLIRFLHRLKIFQIKYLEIIDFILNSIQAHAELYQTSLNSFNMTVSLQKSKQNKKQNQRLRQIFFNLLRQVLFLCSLYTQQKRINLAQETKQNNRANKNINETQNINQSQYSNVKQNQTQNQQDNQAQKTKQNVLMTFQSFNYVQELIQKRLIRYTLAHYAQKLKNDDPSHQRQSIKFRNTVRTYSHIYMQKLFSQQHNPIIQKIFNQPESSYKYQKIFQLFIMISMNNEGNYVQGKQIEIDHIDSIENVSLSLQAYWCLFKQIQNKINIKDNYFHQYQQLLLDLLIQIFIGDEKNQLIEFIKKTHSIDSQKKGSIQEYLFIVTSSKNNKKDPALIRMYLQIQEFQYLDLVRFLDIISTFASYNDRIIHMLFEAPVINGYYGQTHNFETFLQKKLLRHFSLEIRRRSYWLLTNISGSQQCYRYAFNFIKNFYIKNTLEQDYASMDISKQQLLIRQSILQIIMNFLSNLRSYNEIQQLLQFQYQNNSQQKESKICKFSQNMLVWILKVLGSVIKNISQQFSVINENSGIFQILIYSLFNILSLQKSQKQGNDSVLCHLIQINEIQKNVEDIYQNFQVQSDNKVTIQMIEKLLDQIEINNNH